MIHIFLLLVSTYGVFLLGNALSDKRGSIGGGGCHSLCKQEIKLFYELHMETLYTCMLACG